MLKSLQILIISLCFLGLALILGITIYLIKNHNKKEYTCTTENCPSPSSCVSNVCIPPYTNKYQIVDNLSGDDLRPTNNNTSAMIYYINSNDKTQGYVNYGAWDNLIEVNSSGKFIVKADSNLNSGKRKMIRMYSRKSYNDGLFVIKADHIPEGNGVWPAFWLTSKTGTWACGGEIDIIEGVNSIDASSSRNSSTLHTNDGSGVCKQDGVAGIKNQICSSRGGGGDGSKDQCGCNGKEICPYEGCGVELKSPSSFGKGFNQGGGGIYATELTTDGFITIWFFPKGTEPQDLINGTPNPSAWPDSDNVIKFNQCKGNFKNLEMVLNTDLCGTWAGTKFINESTKAKGIPACQNYIDTQDLTEAYWSIDYIKVFQKSELPACSTTSCDVTCKCPDGKGCDSGTCKNNSPACYENDEDVFGDQCKKGVKCCDTSIFCRNSKYKYYCHKGNTCILGDSKVDPGSSIFPECPTGNCNVKNSKLCKYK